MWSGKKSQMESTFERAMHEREKVRWDRTVYMCLPTWYNRHTEESSSCSLAAIGSREGCRRFEFLGPETAQFTRNSFSAQLSLWSEMPRLGHFET
jgi:hypothetical protein